MPKHQVVRETTETLTELPEEVGIRDLKLKLNHGTERKPLAKLTGLVEYTEGNQHIELPIHDMHELSRFKHVISRLIDNIKLSIRDENNKP